jgi:hypothetical protein
MKRQRPLRPLKNQWFDLVLILLTLSFLIGARLAGIQFGEIERLIVISLFSYLN